MIHFEDTHLANLVMSPAVPVEPSSPDCALPLCVKAGRLAVQDGEVHLCVSS